MQVAYSVTYDNGDYRTYSVDEPFVTVDRAAEWLRDTMRNQSAIQLGTTVVNIRHVRSISIREE